MSCIDLGKYVTKQSDKNEELCVVCQEVGLFSLLERCENSDTRHYHISTLDQVAKKSGCPGCRLITSSLNSTSTSIRDDSTLDIVIKLDGHQHKRPPDWRSKRDSYNGQGEPNQQVREGGFHKVQRRGSDNDLGIIIQLADPSLKPFSAGGVGTWRSPGRQVTQDANLGLIKKWIEFCCDNHRECQQPGICLEDLLCFRLIDVHAAKIVCAEVNQSFVALSYVWGSEVRHLLTRGTIDQYSAHGGFKEANLPQTIADAMHPVSELGGQYLWVDTLCIIRDDERDKQVQLPVMGNIYNRADLVFVAAAGDDANAGLPGINGTPREVTQRVEFILGHLFLSTLPALMDVLASCEWNNRGWTIQDA
ncbi:heterokaryon incompatibility protein-domain-containing protein [Xylariales sp. PMI_506]|nr:heterokaryon incompatibility protein-domain-containing protein [Xylariales sp. PMI_506]